MPLSGSGCSAGPPGPPAAAARGGEAAEPRRFLPTREKSLAQAKLFDHKRREAAAQLSSLAGECGNEVTGPGLAGAAAPGSAGGEGASAVPAGGRQRDASVGILPGPLGLRRARCLPPARRAPLLPPALTLELPPARDFTSSR